MNTSESQKLPSRSKRVDWHTALSAAVKINLKDYEKYLEYHDEYFLIPRKKNRKGQNTDRRIDLLIIKMLSDICISVNFARIFRKLNVFELKGKGDTLDTDAYYKGISYVSQLISQSGKKNQYTRKDVTLTFISMSYPRKLMAHLKNLNKTDANCGITIENNADGIYNIHGETFVTQILVANELSPEENKYLRCICDGTANPKLFKEVADDYENNRNDKDYVGYMYEMLKPADTGEVDVMCEAIFELFGTSSEEIAANAAKEAAEKATIEADKKIQALTEEKRTLTEEKQSLVHTNLKLRELLIQNGIPIPE